MWLRPVFLTQRPRLSICSKVGQSTRLLPVLQIHFRFHHDDLLHAFFELRSISRHFGQFRALLKVLPVSELYFRATDLDFVHPVFLLKAFLGVYVRYGDNTSQNKAKKSLPGALEAKPEVEIWRRPVFPTQLPRLPIRLRILYGVYLAPLQLHRERILTLAHCNCRETLNIFAFLTPKSDFSRFFRTLNEIYLSYMNQIFFKISESTVGCRYYRSA